MIQRAAVASLRRAGPITRHFPYRPPLVIASRWAKQFIVQPVRFGLALGIVLLIAGSCWAQVCPIAGQKDEVRITLYFGRDRTGEAPVSDREWQIFSASELTREFPDGFTETDGVGQWRNPATGQIVREPTKVVDVVSSGSGLVTKITTVTRTYEKQFGQISVGVVTNAVCAAF